MRGGCLLVLVKGRSVFTFGEGLDNNDEHKGKDLHDEGKLVGKGLLGKDKLAESLKTGGGCWLDKSGN